MGQAASVSMGFVFSGPLRSVKATGSYAVRVKLEFLPELASGGTATAVGQYVAMKMVQAFTGGDYEGHPMQTIERDEVLLPGMVRYQVPEQVMLPATTDTTGFNRTGTLVRGVRRVGRARPSGWLKQPRYLEPAIPFDAADLGPKGKLRLDDLIIGVYGLDEVLDELDFQADDNGLSIDDAGVELGNLVAEDQVVGRIMYGGENLPVSFQLCGKGIVNDQRVRVLIQLAVYDERATDQVVPLKQGDFNDPEPFIRPAQKRFRAHRWKVNAGTFEGSTPRPGFSDTAQTNAEPDFTFNLKTKYTQNRDQWLWLVGRWIEHTTRDYRVMYSKVLTKISLQSWKENMLWTQLPSRDISYLLIEHGLEYYRPEPQPKQLPPPGVPQVIAAGYRTSRSPTTWSSPTGTATTSSTRRTGSTRCCSRCATCCPTSTRTCWTSCGSPGRPTPRASTNRGRWSWPARAYRSRSNPCWTRRPCRSTWTPCAARAWPCTCWTRRSAASTTRTSCCAPTATPTTWATPTGTARTSCSTPTWSPTTGRTSARCACAGRPPATSTRRSTRTPSDRRSSALSATTASR